jgi:hypothetical protein
MLFAEAKPTRCDVVSVLVEKRQIVGQAKRAQSLSELGEVLGLGQELDLEDWRRRCHRTNVASAAREMQLPDKYARKLDPIEGETP